VPAIALFAAVLVLPLACVQAKTHGGGARQLVEDGSVEPADAADGAADAAPPPADHPILPDTAEAAAARDASELDAAPDAASAEVAPIDLAAADDAGACDPACGPGSTCSDGVCVCAPGSCNEGMFFTDPAGVGFMAASSNALLYPSNGEIKKVDLASGQVSSLYGRKQGALGVGAVAVDARDTVYWCRDTRGDGLGRPYDLMKNEQLVEAGFCGPGLLRVTDTDVYFSDGNNVYRRRLDRAGRETLVKGPSINSMAVGGNHLYYSALIPGGFLRIRQVNLADGTQSTLLDAGELLSQLLLIAIDERHVYIAGDGVRRVPLAGGPVERLVAPDNRALEGIAPTKAHVYWSSEDPNGCETRLYRRPKSGDPAELLATLPNRCNTNFVLQGSHIYLQTSNETGTGPGVVYRLRQ
jgi:hypothetical protein